MITITNTTTQNTTINQDQKEGTMKLTVLIYKMHRGTNFCDYIRGNVIWGNFCDYVNQIKKTANAEEFMVESYVTKYWLNQII